MKVGFIGLGNLGTPIAENLLAKQPIYVYNRTAAKVQALADKGAIVCHSIKELATTCDVIFSTVSDDAAVKAITEGPENIAANLKAGGIHLSVSTILPETSVALEALHQQHGSLYIACPLIGRPDMVRAGKYNFLVSGNAAGIQTIKPLLLQAGAAGVWEFGDEVGAAHIAKLCSNYLIMSAMEALAEGINLANKSNIDTQLWMKMLTQTSFNSPAYINYSKLIMEEAFTNTFFSARLALKDMNLVMQQAANAQAKLPFGQQVQTLLKQTVAAGLGEHDVTVMAKVIKEMQ